ncbi:MAG TPA: dihydroneopterin aldolase [Edaphocola sp.]|nr:dihydroneopterin aldolase [Edaphocola sp.]
MLSVSIKNAIFNAPIGLYPQESKTGNTLSVDVTVSQEVAIHNLPFIDYTELYDCTKNIIAQNHKTLEEIVKELYLAIKLQLGNVQISIKVRKLHPPISGQVDYTEVGFSD